MPFLAASASEIRDRALENWRTRYLLLGRDLDITPGSHAYNEIDALSYELATLGLGAQEAAHRVLLRYQTGEDLDESATDELTSRLPASAARRVVRVNGPASASTAVGSSTLGAAGGQRFSPIDATTGEALAAIATDVAGNADITVECATTGTEGNLGLGSVFTWSSAPTGFSPLGTVVGGATAIDGEDAETDSELRQRLQDLRRHRPGSGNPAEWRSWALGCGGVGDAFFHRATLPPAPPARPGFTIDRLGCATLIVVPPPPAADSYVQNADGTLGAGLLPSYSRRPSQGLCDNVAGFIEGTLDSQGNPVRSAAQRQLYPGVIHRENWGVARPAFGAVDVTIGIITTGGTLDFAFDGTRTVTAAADTTHVTLSSTTDIDVDTRLAFYFGAVDGEGLPTVIRGYWATARVSFKSGSDLTLATPLPAVPSIGTLVRADPAGLWRPVSAAAFALIDSLGPGAPSGLGQSARYPSAADGARASIVPSRLLTAVLAIAGVEDAEIVAPASTSSLGLGVVAVPGVITIQRKLF